MEDIFLKQVLSENLKAHLFIEFYYGRNGNGLFIIEHANTNLEESVLLEQYGVFAGCKQLANHLLNIAKENYKEVAINVKLNNLTWLRQIKLTLKYPKGEAAYVPENTVFGDNELKSINIYLNKNIVGTADALPLLMHELTHAYQDYQLRLKGTSLYKELDKKGYGKNRVSYEEDYTINEKQKRELKYKLSWIIYHLNDFERSSYISQIAGYLDSCGRYFDTINDVYNYLKSTEIYQNYETVFEWISVFLDLTDENLKEFVLDEVKELSNYDFTNYSHFVKWLNNKLNRYKNKFNTILPKIAFNHLKMTKTMIHPTIRKIRK